MKTKSFFSFILKFFGFIQILVLIFFLYMAVALEKDQIKKKSLDLIEAFESGLDSYFNQDWEIALKYFESSNLLEDDFEGRNTNPSKVFINRCNHFIVNPPKSDWDGVWRMNTK